jgi:hypothetical protein
MGQKYVAYDAAGVIIGYFDSEAAVPPPPNVALTLAVSDSDFAACLASLIPYTVDVVNLVLVAPSAAAVLAAAQSMQNALLSSSAGAQIGTGFTSSALGAPYTYALDLVSQSNMQAAAIRMSLTNPAPPSTINYMCADANGVWLRRPHNQTQLLQAAIDGMTYIEAVLAKKDGFVSQINAATTVQAVEAIVWSYP